MSVTWAFGVSFVRIFFHHVGNLGSSLFLCFSIFPHPVTQPCSAMKWFSFLTWFQRPQVPLRSSPFPLYPSFKPSLPFLIPPSFFFFFFFLTLHSLTILLHVSDEGNTLKESWAFLRPFSTHSLTVRGYILAYSLSFLSISLFSQWGKSRRLSQ